MPDKSKKLKLSFSKNGQLGLHFTLNPQPSAPPSARIDQQFSARGLTLGDTQLRALLAGRNQGIGSLLTLVGLGFPTLPVEQRLKIATQLADAVMNASLRAQLAREAPSALERIGQRDGLLQHLLRHWAPPDDTPWLLRRLPAIGISLTIRF